MTFIHDESQATQPKRRRTFKEFFRKYFLEGQLMEESRVIDLPPDADWWDRFHAKYRKYIAFLIPFCFMQTFWWLTALRHDYLSLFPKHWPIPVTVIGGAIVAGITSEGGGALCFPVMTLLLNIDPNVTRDFCVMAQCFGMVSCMFVILYMGIKIEGKTVLFGSIGSLPGMVLGFEVLDALLSPAQKKMFFVSVWGSFAIALYLMNMEKKRVTFPNIQNFCFWKAIVLILTGFVGGIFTAFAGTGVDICAFSVITLLFRVTEKSATPTSVVLMASNSLFASYWRIVQMGDVSTLAYEYTITSIPVAVTVGPIGSMLGSHFHRQVLAWLLYILEAAALVGFLFTGPPLKLIITGALIIVTGFAFFYWLSRMGTALADAQRESTGKQETPENKRLVEENTV